jgi:hypothetical protein
MFEDLVAHGDFVKNVALEVHDLEELVKRAKSGGAEIVQDVTEDKDKFGFVKYAILRTVSKQNNAGMYSFRSFIKSPWKGDAPDTIHGLHVLISV